MAAATRPPGRDHDRGLSELSLSRSDGADEPDATAVHGIVVGCLACSPFWLALLALTLR